MALPMRLTRLAWAVAIASVTAVCGGGDSASPLAPSGRPAALQPGPYDMFISGASCAGLSSPLSINAIVRIGVTREGGVWVVRPASSAGGDFVMRFTEGIAVADIISITGVYSGTAIDPQGFAGSGPLVMTATSANGADLAITGSLKTTLPAGPFDSLGFGTGTGRFVQSARDGTSTCSIFGWSIRPPF